MLSVKAVQSSAYIECFMGGATLSDILKCDKVNTKGNNREKRGRKGKGERERD